jgi:tetratricopeptide (TPR) repeat protein
MKRWFCSILLLGFLTIPVLSEAAETFDTYFSKGLTYYKKKDFKLALKEFDAAVKIDPNISKAYYYMGYAKYKRKDFKGALKDFDQAYRLDQDYSPLLK